MQPQLTDVRRVLIEEVKAAMPQLIAQPAIAQRSQVRNEDEEAAHFTQQTTQPTLHIVHPAQDDTRSKVFTYLDEHPDALDDNEAVMTGAGVSIHAARRYRREYKVARGGAQ